MGKNEAELKADMLLGKYEEQSDMLKEEVLGKMKDDEIGNVAKTDSLILKLGEGTIRKLVKNKLKRGIYTSTKMRLVARTLLEVREIIEDPVASWSDVLKPAHFNSIVQAAGIVGGSNGIDSYEHPSNVLKIGYHLKELTNLKESSALIKSKADEAADASNMKKLLDKNWCAEISAVAVATQSQNRFNKSTNLPIPGDMEKLSRYIIDEIEQMEVEGEMSADKYKRIVQLTLSRLLLYNKRRPGELEAME